ncbi:MAG TPA: stalk domain-containing protein [Symbiobacteriaceae bacterium]|nr:stalk domain-containing protein [Symbiobacteriaceae bacterium]
MSRRRVWLSLLAAGILLITARPTFPATPVSAPQIQIQIDGQSEPFDQSPLLLDGQTLLPLRAIFERLGARVEWNPATQTVTATRDQHRVSLRIGSDEASVDGKPVTLAVPPLLIQGRTYVPVRFVSEALGGYVRWDEQRQLISISRTGHTRSAIREHWLAAQPRFTGEPLALPTVITPPFQAGALQPALLDDGLRMLNFVRYLANLPDDLTLDSTYSDLAQHAAVINAYYGVLNHHPAHPEGMTDPFYEQALKGSSQSNLGAGFRSPADAILRGYMDDSDPSNIDRLGHRRWILSPRMGKVGFGWVASPARYGAFDALYVLDGSRAPDPSFTHWAWPSAGYFPISLFGPEQAWSIGVNPTAVQTSGAVAVTLTRESDSKTWRFSTSGADGYFRVDTAGYGYTQAIIFRPDGLTQLGAEERYQVTVTGLTDQSGAPFPLQYEVTFFNL